MIGRQANVEAVNTTYSGNYFDSSSGPSASVWSQAQAAVKMGASISGNTLVIDGIGGTTVATKGTGYTGSATATFSGGSCSTEPTASVTLSGGGVASLTMLTSGSGCNPSSPPTIAIAGTGTGAVVTANPIQGSFTTNNIVIGAGIAAHTIAAGSGFTWTVSGAPQTVATEFVTASATWCDNPVNFGVGGLTNVDMAGIVTPTNANKIAGQIAGNGC